MPKNNSIKIELGIHGITGVKAVNNPTIVNTARRKILQLARL